MSHYTSNEHCMTIIAISKLCQLVCWMILTCKIHYAYITSQCFLTYRPLFRLNMPDCFRDLLSIIHKVNHRNITAV
jgi:hypothetical protein